MVRLGWNSGEIGAGKGDEIGVRSGSEKELKLMSEKMTIEAWILVGLVLVILVKYRWQK